MFYKEDLDVATRPQDDFFQYANGGWLARNPIPPHESRWGTFIKLREDNWKKLHIILEELVAQDYKALNEVEQKLRNFYLSAIDPAKPEGPGLAFVRDWFERIDSITSTQDIVRLMLQLQRYDISVPWAHYVDIDEMNSAQYVFRFHQAGLGLPDRDYYFKDEPAMEKVRNEYALHIVRMFNLAGLSGTGEASRRVLSIEQALAKASMTRTEQRDIAAQYNKKTLAELAELVSFVNWQEYFDAVECPMQAEVLVDQPLFMQVVGKLLDSEPLIAWQDYFRWHILLNCAAFLGERFEQAQFLFYGKVLNGTEELQPRWKRVVMQMDKAIGEALGKKFVERHFPVKARERMEVLIQDLKDAFAVRIENLVWMSPKTKTYAQEKLRKMKIKIGHPTTWRDYSALQVSAESYVANAFEASRFEIQRNFKKLGRPVDVEEWHMTPQTVNAYAHFNLNEIVFPAGILQPPFFDFEADDAENYGCIGYVIGHEITHGFDDRGCEFDAEGNFRNWRTDQDKQNFDERGKVLIAQASAFEILPGLFMNGELTQGENIGDLGGIEMALDAYERLLTRTGHGQSNEWGNPLQRFFLGFAKFGAENIRPEKAREFALTDPHGAEKFRINGILKNVDRFYEAFSVVEGDGMYIAPEQRVKIW